MDFMTPPTEQRLDEIRKNVETQLAGMERVEIPLAPEPIAAVAEEPLPVIPPEPIKPPVELGDLKAPLTLQTYGERTPQGSEAMIELAKALEANDEFPRALLAWERVLDLTKPTPDQAPVAVNGIKRIRPTLPDWNRETKSAIEVQLQVSAGKNLTKALPAILTAVVKEMEKASSGIVKIKTITTKITATNKNASSVTISMKGFAKKSSTIEPIISTATPENLRQELLKLGFQLISKQLREHTAYTPIPALADGEDPRDALTYRVTRLCWSEFATGLNLPPKKKD